MANGPMHISKEAIELAVRETANTIHEVWKTGYRNDLVAQDKDPSTPRLKPLKAEDEIWLAKNPSALAHRYVQMVQIGDTQERRIDIAALKNEDLTPSHAKENTDSARSALGHIVDDIKLNGANGHSDEKLAMWLHEGWIARANKWLAKDSSLRKEFAHLPKNEQDKDLNVIRVARRSLAKTLNPAP